MDDVERIDWWVKERPKSTVEKLIPLEMELEKAQLKLQILLLKIESIYKNNGKRNTI